MRLLNKSKELFTKTLITTVLLIALFVSATAWKSAFNKEMAYFESTHTAVTDARRLAKGYTYKTNGTPMYASHSKEVMVLGDMNPLYHLLVLVFLVSSLIFIKKTMIEYKKVSDFISEQARLEEERDKEGQE